MTPKHLVARNRRKKFRRRVFRASVIACVLLAVGVHYEFNLLLKLAEFVVAALAEAVLFPE